MGSPGTNVNHEKDKRENEPECRQREEESFEDVARHWFFE
jgi:hypothetical protein